ncbi:MAG: dihydrolipoamide acetyltransferase family protein [Oligoflexales bacterium]
MPNIIKMPKLSDTMEDGGIAEWLKSEGDKVEEGEGLLMIETDKATMEYPSPESGYLLKILQKVGDSVDLNVPIAVLGEQGEIFDEKQLASTLTSTPTQEQQQQSEKPANTQSPQSASTPEKSTRMIASPLAKKIAKEKNIDLENIVGSGPRGRIIAADLESSSLPTEQKTHTNSKHSYEDIPTNRMRKTIAQRLLQAKNDAPHFYLTTSINMSACQEWRVGLNSDEKKPRVSVNDLIMMATARALKKHPQVNASWQGEFIRHHHDVHLAMAVALPDGLVTPVIQNTDQLGIREIAVMTKTMGKKAKDGLLVPSDYQNGTFTISNLGMTRIDTFTAIINPPQACILAIGRIVETPVFNADKELCCHPIMKVTLSCDHRVVDGMVGAQFLETLSSYLEKPLNMLE